LVLRRLSVHVRQISLRRSVAAFTLCLLGAAASACTQTRTAPEAGGRHSWTQPNVLRAALYLSPNSLNPIYTTNTGEVMLATLIFDPLVTVDEKGNEIPVLASVVPTLQNGGISSDGKTITYKLRHNVKWQDGAPFSSADVKFTWQAVMNPNNNVVSRRGYDVVASVDTPGPYTAVFHFREPFSPALETIFSESDEPYRILPKHLLGRYPNLNQIPFNAAPIGTGPFRFVKWLRGDRIELIANPDYFLGRPKLQRIVWRIIPDSNTQVTQMRDHEVDWLPEISGNEYRDLRGTPDVVIAKANSPSYSGIALNMAHPPLNDVRIRRALSYAIDKRKIMETTQFGQATLATEDIPAHEWAYNPNVPRYDYDPGRARTLLEQAGWKPGPDAVRTRAGARLSLLFVIPQGSTAAQTEATLVQSQLHAVGIESTIKTFSFTMLYATVAQGGILNGGKFDIATYPWISGTDPDDSSAFMCKFVPPAGNNIFHFCNAAFDAAERDALGHFDRSTRKAAYARTQTIMAQEIPQIYLFYRKQLHAISPDVRGFAPNGVTETWNAYRWSI